MEKLNTKDMHEMVHEIEEKFAATEQITRVIGRNLKRARQARGFSLDEVSSRSSVSKSMLSDVERGRKCPTVAVLFKICEGIHVSLPSLLKEPDKIVEVVKDQPLVHRNGVDYQPLFKYDIGTSMEIHRACIAPHTEVQQDGHSERVWEYVLVIEGVFTLIIDDEAYEARPGEAIKFLANKKHFFANRTDEPVWVFGIAYFGG